MRDGEEILAGDLPLELTSFIGREREIADLADLLLETRFLTLTGTGGVGKTRLALEVAERRRSSLADGARFVDLAPVANPTVVAQAVLGALGLQAEGGRPPNETLLARLRARELLLVLDNCEHVLPAASALSDSVLRACPGVRILATSREPLGTAGETVWVVPALQLPDRWRTPSVEGVLGSEAGRLFVDRARSALATFRLRPDNAASVAELCWQLDGVPLAIELAAVRVRGLTVAQIAARLGDRFGLLSSGPRTGPPRHQTLRAAVDWSYALLADAEQRLFNRLSVFAGGWMLEAAEAVCSGGGIEPAEVIELLAHLVDRALVVADEQAGVMRYRMFETLRQYAAERLARSGEETQVRERHRAWCLQVAEAGERDIWGADQLGCVRRLAREHDNVRAALSWTLAGAADPEPGLRIAAAMVRFWDVHGDLQEGTRWLSQLLALLGTRRDTLGWARALTARAYLAITAGDRAQGIALLDETLPFWRGLGDPRGMAVALFFRGLAVAWTGTELHEAVPIFVESLSLAEQRGPRWTAYFCLYCLGETARLDGDYGRAAELLEDALARAMAAQDRWGAFYAEYGLAFLAIARGDLRQAGDHAQRSLSFSVELGDARGSTYALEALGCIAAADGQDRRAARLFGAAQALREPLGEFMSATLQVAREQALARVRARVGERGFGAALASGLVVQAVTPPAGRLAQVSAPQVGQLLGLMAQPAHCPPANCTGPDGRPLPPCFNTALIAGQPCANASIRSQGDRVQGAIGTTICRAGGGPCTGFVGLLPFGSGSVQAAPGHGVRCSGFSFTDLTTGVSCQQF